MGPTAPDEPIELAVTYRDEAGAVPSSGLSPEGWFPTETGSYVLNEPDGAHTWMPANDHPSDKATWRFELTVPDGTAAIANGHLVEQRDGRGQDTWVWEQREPMATYLVQLLTGSYEVLDGGRAGDTPLVNVALRRDVEQMQPYFDLTDDQIEFFEPLFGPYPLDQYGLAFTESFPGLAMETQGRSLFSRDDFEDPEPGLIQQLLLAHELAHQWFGNAVTPADWSDLWLNESFASYGQWLWLDHIGLWDLEAQAEANLRQRQSPTEPTGEPTRGNLFGYERYDGGAVVVHALRGQLGDEAFFELLRRWVADNDGTLAHQRRLHRARRGDRRRATRRVLRRLALRRRPPARISLNLSGRTGRRAGGARAPASQGQRPGLVSAASARPATRSPALIPSQRSGSGSHLRDRCPTQGSSTRSVARPVIRSARVRPARLVVATPSPT